jgi:hypothetical protein
MTKRYRLNVDFDNSVVPFLYDGTGEWSFTVPATPNFQGTRYVVFLPCVLMLTDPGQRPTISGYTRIESGIPSANEFRTIPAADWEEFLLKDAIEFPADSAGATLTIENLYTIGSTVDPDALNSYSDDRKGCGVYTRKSTGVDSDLNVGSLHMGEGFIVVNGTEILIEEEQDIVVSSALTAELWHIIYMDTSGIFSIQETTDSNYSQFPIAELDSKAPVNATKTGRYKSTDPNLRAVAVAYTLAEAANYAAGTTYARGARVTEGTTVYVSRINSNTGNTPSSSPTQWLEMGEEGYLFMPKVYNLPEQIFGTGALGDVTLDGTGLGATATPFYGLRETVTGTIEYYPEYEFNNLTISGVCYAGKSDGLSLDPVVIRVKGTLTIESGGQINGDSRGANGGAGGAGGKSGRPLHIYANKIVNQKATGQFWITTSAANGSNGVRLNNVAYGGSGGGSSSGIKIISNSQSVDFILGVNQKINSRGGRKYHSALASYYSDTHGDGGENGNGADGAITETSTSIFGGAPGLGGGMYGGAATGGTGGIYIATAQPGGGGGSYGCGGGGGAATGGTGGSGSAPTLQHSPLGYVTIIDQYEARAAI